MTAYIHPISQLVHSTVRILCFDVEGRSSSGSGYIYLFCENDGNSVPCVVTNKHVVRGAIRGVFNLTLKKKDGSPDLGQHESITVKNLDKMCVYHPDPNVDLAVLPIGPLLNAANRSGKDYYYVPLGRELLPTPELLDSLPPMEEIVMIGYPNGIWDETHNLPIIRRGITATHPKLALNGKPEFLIDAACFPGSSGSPVFLANIGSFVSADGALCAGSRISLLGTLYAGPQHTTTGEVVVVEVPTDTKTLAVGSIPNNLGYVISSAQLSALEDSVRKLMEPQPARNSPCPCGSGQRFKACCGGLA
ncbi:hypothetical protein GGR74_003274 [Xanthomonas arboricola]